MPHDPTSMLQPPAEDTAEARRFRERLKTYLQGVGIGVLLVIALLIVRSQMAPNTPPPVQQSTVGGPGTAPPSSPLTKP